MFQSLRDLEKKAARWNDKQLSALKSNKEKLSEELREAMKKSRKESELHTVKLQIKGKFNECTFLVGFLLCECDYQF